MFRSPLDASADPGDHGGATVPTGFSGLMKPTWAELDQARMQYESNARRLRVWRWWFVGMFTFYTTLAGILLFHLLVG